MLKRFINYSIKRTKDDWNGLINETKTAKKEIGGIVKEAKQEYREETKDAPSVKESFAELKVSLKEGPTYSEIREKQRRKEAERKPSVFMKLWSGITAIALVVIAIPLMFTVVGIPFAIVMIALAIYFWRKDVSKKVAAPLPKYDPETGEILDEER